MRQSFAPPGLLVALLGLCPAAAHAAGPPPAVPAAPVASAQSSGTPTDAQRFCQNVAAAAADARFALQTRKLNDLQKGIADRIAALEAKETEVKAVLAEHDQAKKQAEATLVGIYAKMRPDAAAQQIAALDDAIAAAVLQGLNARQSSAILNEIPAERAVKLVDTIAGLVPPPLPPPPPAPPPEDSRS